MHAFQCYKVKVHVDRRMQLPLFKALPIQVPPVLNNHFLIVANVGQILKCNSLSKCNLPSLGV